MKGLARRVGSGVLLAWGGACASSAYAGEGFYLGLEGGANFPSRENFKLYGDQGGILVTPIPDGTLVAREKFKTGWLGGVTAGYGLANGLRPEIAIDFRSNKVKKGETLQGAVDPTLQSADLDGKQEVGTAMANLWIDMFKSGSIHPYIGGGLGAAKVKIKDASVSSTDLSSSSDVRFAWQVGAGVEADIGHNLDVGLGYRYLRVNTGTFSIVKDDDRHMRMRYRAHSALVSLRYSFGGKEEPVTPPEAPPQQVEVVPVQDASPAPEPPPPPPPPSCQLPEAGQPITLDGCKAGDKIVLRGVNFDFNKSTLTANAKTILDQVADALGKRTDIKVEIDGHTDSKGSDSYNEQLSQRRAESVRQYLIGRGIDAGRMTTKGFGESEPVADNETDEGRELNRRVELKITEGGGGDVSVAPPAGPDASSGAPAADAAAPAGDAAAPAADASAPAADAAPAGDASAPAQ